MAAKRMTEWCVFHCHVTKSGKKKTCLASPALCKHARASANQTQWLCPIARTMLFIQMLHDLKEALDPVGIIFGPLFAQTKVMLKTLNSFGSTQTNILGITPIARFWCWENTICIFDLLFQGICLLTFIWSHHFPIIRCNGGRRSLRLRSHCWNQSLATAGLCSSTSYAMQLYTQYTQKKWWKQHSWTWPLESLETFRVQMLHVIINNHIRNQKWSCRKCSRGACAYYFVSYKTIYKWWVYISLNIFHISDIASSCLPLAFVFLHCFDWPRGNCQLWNKMVRTATASDILQFDSIQNAVQKTKLNPKSE